MKKYEEKIQELEASEKFDEHVIPVDPSFVKPLDKNYNYTPKNIFFKTYSALIRTVVKLATPVFNIVVHRVKIEGKRNLKHIKKAIVISNHVLYTDSLLVRQAVKKKLYIAGASFNHKKGIAGTTLKAGGFIPLGDSVSTTKKFNDALSRILDKNNFVLFYPEQAMWPEYEKPRPLKRGAFYYAVKNDVPIVPIFLCFRNKSDKFKKSNKTKVTVKILPPIFANTELEERECIDDMRLRAEAEYKIAYEDFYNKPLIYGSNEAQEKDLPDCKNEPQNDKNDN